MDNIKLTYLYRDAGNYKNWSSVVFSNPDSMTLAEVTKVLRDKCLEDGLFVAQQIRIPEVFFYPTGAATSDDHCFHELHAVDGTIEPPNDRHHRTISEFLIEVAREAKLGWEAFDPHNRRPVRPLRLTPKDSSTRAPRADR